MGKLSNLEAPAHAWLACAAQGYLDRGDQLVVLAHPRKSRVGVFLNVDWVVAQVSRRIVQRRAYELNLAVGQLNTSCAFLHASTLTERGSRPVWNVTLRAFPRRPT